MRKLKFKFSIPQIYGGYYDPDRQEAFVFALNTPENLKKYFIEDMENYINHETLHYLIQKLANTDATYKFDKIAKKILKWDEEVFEILY